jgi:hypothetical protein
LEDVDDVYVFRGDSIEPSIAESATIQMGAEHRTASAKSGSEQAEIHRNMAAGPTVVSQSPEDLAVRTTKTVLPEASPQAAQASSATFDHIHDAGLPDPLSVLDHSAETLARMDRQAEREASNAEKRRQWEANKAVSLISFSSKYVCCDLKVGTDRITSRPWRQKSVRSKSRWRKTLRLGKLLQRPRQLSLSKNLRE